MLTITHTHTVCTILFIQPLIKKMSLLLAAVKFAVEIHALKMLKTDIYRIYYSVHQRINT